jgi:hypothetical protein
MTLEELKKRATASEATLIEAVEAALRPAIVKDVTDRVFHEMNKQFEPAYADLKDWFRERHYSGGNNPLKTAFDNTCKALQP